MLCRYLAIILIAELAGPACIVTLLMAAGCCTACDNCCNALCGTVGGK